MEVEMIPAKDNFLEMSPTEVARRTENDLSNSIGKNELIVFADPVTTMMAEGELKKRYAKQKFVGYGQSLVRVIKKLKTVYILTTQKISRLDLYQRMKGECQGTKIMESGGEEWIELTKKDKVKKEEIMEKVKAAQGAPILVFRPDLSLQKMKEIVDWRGEVVDMEKELLVDIKNELGLKRWLI